MNDEMKMRERDSRAPTQSMKRPGGDGSGVSPVAMSALIERSTSKLAERRALERLARSLDGEDASTLAETLARMAAMKRRLDRLEDERLVMADALSAIPCAMMVLGDSARVRVANRRALRLLRRHPALRIEDGVLRCLDAGGARAFEKALRATREESGTRRWCTVKTRQRSLRLALAGLCVGRPPTPHTVVAILDERETVTGAVGFEGLLEIVAASSVPRGDGVS
jgi:PAS domain-containing protein